MNVDILLAGASGVGKATLLHALQASRRSASEGPDLYSLNLNTKYYTATLLVQCLQARNCIKAAVPQPSVDQVQALVLMIDASSDRSFEDAMLIYKSFGSQEYGVQLLVVNKVDSLQQQHQCDLKPQPAWLEGARTWCYENGFEYIEAAAGCHTIDASLHEEGEQQGVARILAALEAHMWPSMQLRKGPVHHSSKRSPVKATAGSTERLDYSARHSIHVSNSSDQGRAVQLGQVVGKSATAHGCLIETPSSKDAVSSFRKQQSPCATKDPTPLSSCVVGDAEDKTVAADAHARSCEASQCKADQKQQQQQRQRRREVSFEAHSADATQLLDDEAFLGTDADDFEQLMRQVMGARTKLAGLPDDERRAAAANLALQLSSVLGLEDESDSGSEGSSQDGDSDKHNAQRLTGTA